MIDPNSSGFIDDNQPTGTVQEDTKEAVLGKEPEYINSGIDLISGKPREVLEKGSCSENALGDTAPQPEPVVIVDVPGDKNDVGA